MPIRFREWRDIVGGSCGKFAKNSDQKSVFPRMFASPRVVPPRESVGNTTPTVIGDRDYEIIETPSENIARSFLLKITLPIPLRGGGGGRLGRREKTEYSLHLFPDLKIARGTSKCVCASQHEWKSRRRSAAIILIDAALYMHSRSPPQSPPSLAFLLGRDEEEEEEEEARWAHSKTFCPASSAVERGWLARLVFLDLLFIHRLPSLSLFLSFEQRPTTAILCGSPVSATSLLFRLSSSMCICVCHRA